MDEDRKTNNSMWIVEEYTEWLDKAIESVKGLYDECNSTDKSRLYIKLTTLQMAKEHFDNLKYN